MTYVPRNAHELRLRIAADMAELARIEGKRRIVCPHIIRIVDRVAQETGVPSGLILSDTRAKHVVDARWLAFFAAREAGFSLKHIGRAMGRDHTTVLHGIRAEKARRAQ